MIDIKTRWNNVVDPQTWAARRASFVGKVRATKTVWFPPEPAQAGTKTATTTKRAARKTARSATKASRPATKASRPAEKTSRSAKKTTTA
jgi:hypothetical protein